ncbi:MAG: clostripain-related cysteine peptidase [Clostridium sp.]|nr:clostripain-related cysteine peptidase [Clostridium sp.]
MKTYIHQIALIFSLLAGIALSACGSSDEPTPPKEKGVKRTVLVYMLASNNLGDDNGNDFDRLDLEEMLEGAKKGALNGGRLLVYHAEYAGAQMKEVTAEGITSLKTYDDGALSVSSTRMRDVIDDMKSLAPAEDYGLILWGHATGWLQDGIDDPIDDRAKIQFYSYGYDQNRKNYMNTSTLARTLEGQGLSFIYFDCCLMGSAEALYEMKDAAPRMIASATEVPGRGSPYDLVLPYLFSAGEADLEGASRAYFNYYKTNPSKADGCPVSTAVINATKLGALAQATRKIYEQATETCPEGYIGQLLYTNTNYNDFGHYVMTLAGSENPLYAEWKKALDEAVEYKEASESIWGIRPIEHFCGLSTFVIKKPSDASRSNYNTLRWYDDVASALPVK